MAAEADALRKELKAAKVEIEALRDELGQAQQGHSDLQAKLDTALSEQLEALFAGVDWKSDPEVVVLRKKLEAAATEITSATAARTSARGYAERLETRLRSANQEITDIRQAADAEAKTSAEEIEQLRAAVAEAEAARARSAEQVLAIQAKEDVWAGRLVSANKSALIAAAGAQTLRDKWRDDLAELESVKASLAEAQATLAETEGLRDGMQQAKSRIGDLEGELKEVGSERDTLKVELDKARSEIAKRIEQVFAAAAGDSSSQVDSLRKELEASNKQLASLQASSRDSSREAEELKKELKSLKEDSEALKGAIAKAESAQASAEAKLAEAQTTQEGRLQKLERTAETAEALAQEAAVLRRDIEDSKRQIAEITEEREDAERAKIELAKVLSKQQQETERLQQALRRSLVVRKQLGDRLEDVLAEKDAQAEAPVASEASAGETAELRRQLDVTNQQLTRIKGELARTKAEVEAARGEIAKRIERLISVAAEEGAGGDVVSLKEQLAAANQEISRLKTALKKQTQSGAVNN